MELPIEPIVERIRLSVNVGSSPSVFYYVLNNRRMNESGRHFSALTFVKNPEYP
jgi:hypothetical protein